eukprot:1644616-Amphidinium_carterae.2
MCVALVRPPLFAREALVPACGGSSSLTLAFAALGARSRLCLGPQNRKKREEEGEQMSNLGVQL